jgi:hypothetical protein
VTSCPRFAKIINYPHSDVAQQTDHGRTEAIARACAGEGVGGDFPQEQETFVVHAAAVAADPCIVAVRARGILVVVFVVLVFVRRGRGRTTRAASARRTVPLLLPPRPPTTANTTARLLPRRARPPGSYPPRGGGIVRQRRCPPSRPPSSSSPTDPPPRRRPRPRSADAVVNVSVLTFVALFVLEQVLSVDVGITRGWFGVRDRRAGPPRQLGVVRARPGRRAGPDEGADEREGVRDRGRHQPTTIGGGSGIWESWTDGGCYAR